MTEIFRGGVRRRRRRRRSLALLAALAVAGGLVAALLAHATGPAEAERSPDIRIARPAQQPPERMRIAPERDRDAGRRDSRRAAGHGSERRRADWPRVDWRRSRALGTPTAGRLRHGVQLPREGRHFFTWDPVRRTSPNRSWRRHGTDGLVRTVRRVLADHREGGRRRPRVGVGDLSRPHGGDFGIRWGIVGHASHQNGLDVDVYYPRRDRVERPPASVRQIDRRLAQDLVDRFVHAGAQKVFIGPSTRLTGPREVVQVVPNHDNHLHVRIPRVAG